MGIFTSKIITGVIAGGFTLAGAGLLFSGSDTLHNATSFVKDAGARLAQYEQNENTLIGKIGAVKADASTKLASANETIDNLNGQITTLSNEKATLQSTVDGLKSDIDGLKASIADLNAKLAAEQGDHAKTKAALDAKTAEYDAKVKELGTANASLAAANKKIADYEAAARVALEKAKEADQHITQLEGEVQKANAEVADHGRVVDEVKADTSADQPLDQADIDAIDTTVK
jgi:chromosome segregation ATPase